MRKSPKFEANVLNPDCPSRRVLELISDKWTAMVVRVLSRGTHRYAELQRSVGGISQKMLTQTLRALERDGMVARTVYPEVPPRVEYHLTPLGESLLAPLDAICDWAEAHWEHVQKARAPADAPAPAAASKGETGRLQ